MPSSIEHRRQQVLAEIDVPRWYWLMMGAGWLVLGILADYGPVWATIAGTRALRRRPLRYRSTGTVRAVEGLPKP